MTDSVKVLDYAYRAPLPPRHSQQYIGGDGDYLLVHRVQSFALITFD